MSETPLRADYDSLSPIERLLSDIEAKAQRLYLSEEEFVEISKHEYLPWNSWEELQPVIAEEQRKRALSEIHQQMERTIRRHVIKQWIKKHVSGSDSEKDGLEYSVDFYIQEHDTDSLSLFLNDVLKVGVRQAEKRRSRRKWGDGGYFGHALEVLQGSIRLFVVWAIFEAAQSKFETVVFALLVLIYSSIVGKSYGDDAVINKATAYFNKNFKRLRRLLRDSQRDEAQSIEWKDDQEFYKSSARYIIRTVIASVFLLLIWLLAAVKLLMALL